VSGLLDGVTKAWQVVMAGITSSTDRGSGSSRNDAQFRLHPGQGGLDLQPPGKRGLVRPDGFHGRGGEQVAKQA
jgi:hypothetical protein